jgi:site-specific recombinase XerC
MITTVTSAAELLPTPADHTADLLAAFFGSLSPNTVEAYRRDLYDFAADLGVADVDTVARRLLGGTHGEANGLALAYRSHMIGAGRSPATINRRLSALRSLNALARTLGLVSWTLEVRNVKSEAYRYTRGPQLDGVMALLAAAKRQAGTKAVRHVAMIRLLYDLTLRRGEVVRIDLADVDVAGRRLWVLGKGRREKAPLTLPDATLAAITSWIAARGGAAGPLFTHLDITGKGAAGRSGSVDRGEGARPFGWLRGPPARVAPCRDHAWPRSDARRPARRAALLLPRRLGNPNPFLRQPQRYGRGSRHPGHWLRAATYTCLDSQEAAPDFASPLLP